MFEFRMLAIETRIVNVAARRILSVRRSARVVVLHAADGIFSVRNIVIFHFAYALDMGSESGGKLSEP